MRAAEPDGAAALGFASYASVVAGKIVGSPLVCCARVAGAGVPSEETSTGLGASAVADASVDCIGVSAAKGFEAMAVSMSKTVTSAREMFLKFIGMSGETH